MLGVLLSSESRKLKDRDARIGNLEDTVDALSGRIESEIARGEKLSTQNGTMKDLIEKQAKVRRLRCLLSFPHLASRISSPAAHATHAFR